MTPTKLMHTTVQKTYGLQHLDRLTRQGKLTTDQYLNMKAVAHVWPFKTNHYVLEELIDWGNVPNDPIFQLTMPQPGMLNQQELVCMKTLLTEGAPVKEIQQLAQTIRAKANPHPAGQSTENRPQSAQEHLGGIQHKYRETVLFFPKAGQTCHAYCTYCFRWPQFIGDPTLQFAEQNSAVLKEYLLNNPQVTDVLLTGGDPLIMRTTMLKRYLEPLLTEDLEHLTSIRIGTKALAYWPTRFYQDRDSDDLLRLFEHVIEAGKNLTLMLHISHPRELETPQAQKAIARLRGTGVVLRSQAPLIRHVNACGTTWQRMWALQVHLGIIPYYMFVLRDTGPMQYFQVPLEKAFKIFTLAFRNLSGLARTVRGPVMSSKMGKILVDGIETIGHQNVFVLKYLQARDPSLVNRVFFAKFSPKAMWINDLQPAWPCQERFFQT